MKIIIAFANVCIKPDLLGLEPTLHTSQDIRFTNTYRKLPTVDKIIALLAVSPDTVYVHG